LQLKYGKGIIQMKGFECMVELLAKAISLKLKISEVPMVVDWNKRKGKSKMKVLKTIRGYFKLFSISSKIIGEKIS
jgi:dolichol-phosphate mannosyltransferase